MKYIPHLFFIIIFHYCFAFAHTITEIREMVEEELEREKFIDHIIVRFNAGSHLKSAKDIELLATEYELNSNKVKLSVTSGGQKYLLEGIGAEAVTIPTLTRKVNKGEVLNEDMFKETKYPKDKLSVLIIQDIKESIGKSAKKTLQPNKPVKLSELMSPTIINKGQKVTLQFNKTALIIETLGVALEAGGLDDIIKLKNIDSGKLVIGRIKNAQVVEVGGKI